MTEVTLKDIARAAGVSAATVDRVLHGRGNSRPDTIARIQKVIEELGYRPNLAASQLVRGRGWSIGVFIPDTKVEFLEELADSIPNLNAQFSSLGVSIKLGRADPSDPLAFTQAFSDFTQELDACAVLAPNDPAMAELVRKLESNDVYVATLVSDLSSSVRTLFAGPDNGAMGATAGQLCLPVLQRTSGMAIVIKPRAIQEDHEARFTGFFRALRSGGISEDRFKALRYQETRDSEEMSEILSEELQRTGVWENVSGESVGKQIDAVYLTGGRTTPLIAAIEKLNFGNPTIIGTDLTKTSSRFLIERRLNAVVASDAVGELRDAINGLLRKLTEPFWKPENITRPVQVFTRFNLPVQ